MVSRWLSVCPSIHLLVSPSVVQPSIFSFLDDNFSHCKWIYTKLGLCIDIAEIVNGQILSIFDNLSAHDRSLFSFPNDNFSKCQWIFTKLGVCIDIVEIVNRQILSIFDKLICQ